MFPPVGATPLKYSKLVDISGKNRSKKKRSEDKNREHLECRFISRRVGDSKGAEGGN